MQHKEYHSEQYDREDTIVAIDCNFTDVPLEGIHSNGLSLAARPKSLLNCLNREQSVRSLLMKKSPSEVIKNNILKSRYSKRKEQLKELTHNNVQMFLRIKAQSSHYSLKQLKPQIKRVGSTQLSRAKDTIPDSDNADKENKQTMVRFRCKSAKLINRCSQLKQTISKDRREGASTGLTVYTDKDHNDCGNLKIRLLMGEIANDKENQGNNCEKTRVLKKTEVNKELQRRIITKKLGFNSKRQSQPLKLRAIENQKLMLERDYNYGCQQSDKLKGCTESKKESNYL